MTANVFEDALTRVRACARGHGCGSASMVITRRIMTSFSAGADALVAVGKGMVLDDEIEQVRRLCLDGRVGRLAEDALAEIA